MAGRAQAAYPLRAGSHDILQPWQASLRVPPLSCMRNLLGWLENRLAQMTLNYLTIGRQVSDLRGNHLSDTTCLTVAA